VTSELAVPDKPRLRGVWHYYGFFVAVGAAILLVVTAPAGRARAAATVFGAAAASMFGASALLHRGHWNVAQHRRLTQLDHTAIFLLIAATYTPIGWLGRAGALSVPLLWAIWIGAGLGIVLEWLPFPPPRGYVTGVFVGLGWIAAAAFPGMWNSMGPGGLALVVGGGVLYTAGAFVHALRKPDPWPSVFGYHEIWHACVAAAAALHYALIAFVVLPKG
jgi:hemolysin III